MSFFILNMLFLQNRVCEAYKIGFVRPTNPILCDTSTERIVPDDDVVKTYHSNFVTNPGDYEDVVFNHLPNMSFYQNRV